MPSAQATAPGEATPTQLHARVSVFGSWPRRRDRARSGEVPPPGPAAFGLPHEFRLVEALAVEDQELR